MRITIRKNVVTGILLIGAAFPCFGNDADVQLTNTAGTSQFTVQNVSGSVVFSVTSTGTVTVSSNTVLRGTTFYNNSTATISSATANGFFALMPLPRAAIRGAIVPTDVGQLYSCTNCAAGSAICISTGTATNLQWASIASSTTACN